MDLYASGFLALLVCVAGVGMTAARAQTRDKYLISAKAGGINYLSGNVTVNRSGTSGQQTLTDQDNLEDGDVVTTAAGGRVEVLLNPGSYLRVAENSEFELADTSLEHVRIKLLRGSAIIEVVGTDGDKLALKVDTPQTSAVIVKRGIYRVNVLETGETEVLVRKGRALVGATAQEVKSGKMIVIGRGMMATVMKMDKRLEDSLDLWSQDRAEYLASINKQIQPRVLSASLLDYSDDSGWMSNRNRNYGAWVYDSQRGCYVFLPGRGGASSPYGYGYANWGGRGCGCVNGRGNETPPMVPPQAPGNGGNPVGTGNNPPPSPPTQADNPPSSTPPTRSDPPTVSAPSAPAYSPPPPSSPPTSAPSGTSAPMMRENPND
jgi:hypothetical protein